MLIALGRVEGSVGMIADRDEVQVIRYAVLVMLHLVAMRVAVIMAMPHDIVLAASALSFTSQDKT